MSSERGEARWYACLVVIALLALALRAVFPLADPPWAAPIGITWHDEGVWAHNARNKALFGQWRIDEWNPLYVSPVFTVLEYSSFSLFGVGLWQARLVSIAGGTFSVVALALGLRAIAPGRAALAGALLLAVNHTWVMYSRVALLEATMVTLLVASWACYARAERHWGYGAAAAALALLAFFTKASAAFFLIALGLEACWSGWLALRNGSSRALRAARMRAPIATLTALAAGTLVALAVFVVPNWGEYSFYNLFVYGSRRAATGAAALVDRASWFPVVHGFFTRQWLLTAAALGGLAPLLVYFRRVAPGERLLALWFLLGAFELVLHDLGNERRYVFLLPSMAALAALFLAPAGLLPVQLRFWGRRRLALALPAVLAGSYVLLGSLTREVFMPDVGGSVRSAAAGAVVMSLSLLAAWPRVRAWLASLTWPRAGSAGVLTLVLVGDLAQFASWARARTYKNVAASRTVGALLPDGTLVQGKLANGLALDNRIRPLFIGPGFGNYRDRLNRDDVEWILSYSRPRLGYEGAVIRELLDAMPGWQVVAEFPVAETRSGDDRAVLIRKPRVAGERSPSGGQVQ